MALAGCVSGPAIGVVSFADTAFRPDQLQPDSVEAIFRYPCTECHFGLDAPGQLNLSAQAWDNLVDERAFGNPTMFRVVPGDPESSYLLHKVRGTHLGAGGAGDAMPPPEFAMPEEWQLEAVEVIEAWIRDGAPALR